MSLASYPGRIFVLKLGEGRIRLQVYVMGLGGGGGRCMW